MPLWRHGVMNLDQPRWQGTSQQSLAWRYLTPPEPEPLINTRAPTEIAVTTRGLSPDCAIAWNDSLNAGNVMTNAPNPTITAVLKREVTLPLSLRLN